MNERAQEITSGLPPDLDARRVRRIFACVGIAMTRLETFIYAAFAFAITAAGYLNAENRHMLKHNR